MFDEVMHHVNTLKLTHPPNLDKKQAEKKSLEEYCAHQFHIFAACSELVARVDLMVKVE